MEQEKTVFISIRIPQELKDKLKFNALEKKVTLKKYVCDILIQRFKEERSNVKQLKKRKNQ